MPGPIRSVPGLYSIPALLGRESAIYFWMPTLVRGYRGPHEWIAIYGVSIFSLLRASGRFLGAWILTKLSWHLPVRTRDRFCRVAVRGILAELDFQSNGGYFRRRGSNGVPQSGGEVSQHPVRIDIFFYIFPPASKITCRTVAAGLTLEDMHGHRLPAAGRSASHP